MGIFLDILQFTGTSVLFSIGLFFGFMYIKTRDFFIGKTLGVILPTTIYFLISYINSYMTKYVGTYYLSSEEMKKSGIAAYFFAIFTVAVISMSIITVCHYGVSLMPVARKRRGIGYGVIIIASVLFLVLGIFLITLYSGDDFAAALNSSLTILYPIGSIAAFLTAVVLASYYKSIKDKQQQKLARYFMTAFIPQIAYTLLDLLILKSYLYQYSQLSYMVFGILSFYYVSMHYFHTYENTGNLQVNINGIMKTRDLSAREAEVLELLLKGMTNSEIAQNLFISINTVKSHIKNIYRKMSVSNRLQLIHSLRNHPNG